MTIVTFVFSTSDVRLDQDTDQAARQSLAPLQNARGDCMMKTRDTSNLFRAIAAVAIGLLLFGPPSPPSSAATSASLYFPIISRPDAGRIVYVSSFLGCPCPHVNLKPNRHVDYPDGGRRFFLPA
jgi:hypothetical protein